MSETNSTNPRFELSSQVREGHLSVPGARLYWREIGSGAPLVILHGGPDFNHRYLLPEMDRLASSFRLIYYDQRGRGKSSSGVAPEDVSLESELEDLDRLRLFLKVDALALLGHSWGGILAMEYAARHPDRLSRLILLSSAPASHADWMRLRTQREVAEAENLARMRAISNTPEFVAGDIEAEAAYYRIHFSAALRRAKHVETVVGRLRLDFTPADILRARAIEDRLAAQTWQAPDYDLLPRLRRSSAPALVVHGAHDLIPVESSQNIAAAIPGARLVVLGDCGHFAYLESPVEWLDAIAGWAGR
ncbi:MAG: alpha/beta hydrolase [Candidatus Eiseniibacteriota bacterium]